MWIDFLILNHSSFLEFRYLIHNLASKCIMIYICRFVSLIIFTPVTIHLLWDSPETGGGASRRVWGEGERCAARTCSLPPSAPRTWSRGPATQSPGFQTLTHLDSFPVHLRVCGHSIQKLNAFSSFSWTLQWGSQGLGVLIAAKELKYIIWWFVSYKSSPWIPYNFKNRRSCLSSLYISCGAFYYCYLQKKLSLVRIMHLKVGRKI